MNARESSMPPPSGGCPPTRPRVNRMQPTVNPQCRDRAVPTEELGKPQSMTHKDSKEDVSYLVLARTYLWEFFD